MTNIGDPPGWSFEVEEVSAGVYRVRGADKAGRTVERSGTDPEALLQRCKLDAAEMIKTLPDRRERTGTCNPVD